MKKVFLKSFSVFMAILLLAAQGQSLSAKTIDLGLPSVDESALVLDESSLNQAFAELNVLDSYVSQNEGVTYSDLQASGSELILNVSDSSSPMGMGGDGELPLGVPAFWWGCVLGWVGLLVVYLVTDNDKAQVKKALTGCLVATGAYVVFYVLWYALWRGAVDSIY